jgi:hypothetical protein
MYRALSAFTHFRFARSFTVSVYYALQPLHHADMSSVEEFRMHIPTPSSTSKGAEKVSVPHGGSTARTLTQSMLLIPDFYQ